MKIKHYLSWLFFAKEFLPYRTKKHKYLILAIELEAMQEAGLCSQQYAVSSRELAELLTDILKWKVDRTSLYKQMQRAIFHQEQVEESLKFWNKVVNQFD